MANLIGANLSGVDLSGANLVGAALIRANLSGTDLSGSRITSVELHEAIYAPVGAPPDPSYIAGISGLASVTFPEEQEVGLVQLRELLQRNGLRDLEREATFALERGRTEHAIRAWRKEPMRAAEGVFRRIAFGWTTAYGLHPARALFIIVLVWALLIPAYVWAIAPSYPQRIAGVYRFWPSDRIEIAGATPLADSPPYIERLQRRGWGAVGWAAYFSLLSAFHIGFREFSVGTWIARIQPEKYSLEAAGWVRSLSGLQALLSVYLLALWALTYFGRPFQ